MTYAQLAFALANFPGEQLAMDVTVKINGEFIPVAFYEVETDSDVLDKDHPVLTCL